MLGGRRISGQYGVAQRNSRRQSLGVPTPGFTVIEVMIVLAVTGMLFIGAVILISGKQNQTAFNQAIRQVQSQLQQIINEVAIGYYPNLGNVQCSGAGGTVTLTNAVGTAQGANAGCIFLGKALQFKMTGTDPEQINVYSIAGLQQGGAGGAESSSMTDAKPKVIAPTSVAPGLPDSTVSEKLENGLTTTRMWYNNGGVDHNIGIIAFTNSLASFDPSGSGAILSGAQQVNVMPIDDGEVKSKLGTDKNSGVTVINSTLIGLSPDAKTGVFICFASGGTNQSGLITIGSNGRQLAVKLAIKNGTTC